MGGGGGAMCITLNDTSWYSVCAAQQGMVFTNKDLIVKWCIYNFITLHPEKGCT